MILKHQWSPPTDSKIKVFLQHGPGKIRAQECQLCGDRRVIVVGDHNLEIILAISDRNMLWSDDLNIVSNFSYIANREWSEWILSEIMMIERHGIDQINISNHELIAHIHYSKCTHPKRAKYKLYLCEGVLES